MYQALLYLKTNLPVCLFTHSKGIKFGPSCQEISGVSKVTLAMKHPVVMSLNTILLKKHQHSIYMNALIGWWLIPTLPAINLYFLHMARKGYTNEQKEKSSLSLCSEVQTLRDFTHITCLRWSFT